MSATVTALRNARPPAARGREVVIDRAAGEWLVQEQVDIAGMPTWAVTGRHPNRAVAEDAAGHHDSPMIRWMLYDPGLGWRRSTGHAWLHAPGLLTQLTQADAEALALADHALQLFVVRQDGRVTCPDLEGSAP